MKEGLEQYRGIIRKLLLLTPKIDGGCLSIVVAPVCSEIDLSLISTDIAHALDDAYGKKAKHIRFEQLQRDEPGRAKKVPDPESQAPKECIGIPTPMHYQTLLASHVGTCDVLLIESPAVLAFAEIDELAQTVDGVVLIAIAHETTSSDLQKAERKLIQVGGHLIGYILDKRRRASRAWYR